jgi:hypothetical protein
MANDKTNAFEKDVIDYFLRPGAPRRRARRRSRSLCSPRSPTPKRARSPKPRTPATPRRTPGLRRERGQRRHERTSNAAIIDFPAIVGADVTVVGSDQRQSRQLALVKAVTPKTYSAGDIPRINAGALTHDEG